jgi:hypothetical protein
MDPSTSLRVNFFSSFLFDYQSCKKNIQKIFPFFQRFLFCLRKCMCKAPNTMKTIKLYVKQSSIILLKNRNDPGPEKPSYIMKSPDPNEHDSLSLEKPDPIVCNPVPNLNIRKTIHFLENRRSNTGKPKIQVLESHKPIIRSPGTYCRTLSIDRSSS